MIKSFVTVKLCGFRLNSQTLNHSGCTGVETSDFPPYEEVYSEELDNSNAYNGRDNKTIYLDVQFIGLPTPEALNGGCTLSGEGECDTGSRSIRLVTPAA